MSTRQQSVKQLIARSTRVGGPGQRGALDGAEAVALVARSCRERLLAVNRHRLLREDLEDCYSQATLELLTSVAGGKPFSSYAHITNALDQRLLSRIHDRRRALSGRSPIEAAIATALPIDGCGQAQLELPDTRADVEGLTLLRYDLRRISELSEDLSGDQRLVLASQLAGELGCREFCRAHGWSSEKYRKVAQRGRVRLKQLLAADVVCPACRRASD